MTRRMMKMNKRKMINIIRDNVNNLFNRVIYNLPTSLNDKFVLRFVREDKLTLKCIDSDLLYFVKYNYPFHAIVVECDNDKFVFEKVLFNLRKINKYENYEALHDDDGRKIGYRRKDMFVFQNDTHRFYLVETVYSCGSEFSRVVNASYKYFPSSLVKQIDEVEFPHDLIV
ncbi:hypothetical protein [Parageobacillus galactosidasius]|uniref:Uncharacterized protein n=1 Tax=Parageobacillus galactosidasius TaxID=883812 RepID=A0A226QQM1_9BACL|nr:hypothetical protein [Parageobacillus galactosidasius]OXB94793.1 hypothetical protein B9L23_07995 [Parageobacillus galactosidasius]